MRTGFYGKRPTKAYTGIILSLRKRSARQLVLTIFTREKGILYVLVRRSTRGKLGYGSLMPLAEITFDVEEKDGLLTLAEYDCRANRSLLNLTWASYVYSQIFVEIILFLTSPGEADETLYQLIRLYGRAIELKDVRIVTLITGWQAVALTGFLPDIEHVQVFSGNYSYGSQPAYYVGQSAKNMQEIKISQAIKATWLQLVHYDWGHSPQIHLRKKDVDFLEILLYNYVGQCREKKMKAPELLFSAMKA